MLTRRDWLRSSAGLLGAAVTSAACKPASIVSPMSNTAASNPPPAPDRMPAVFLPHGGGPWPFMDDEVFGAPGMWDQMESYMRSLAMTPPRVPDAVLVVSAHWEESVPTVMSAERPPMYYDYSGFPPETYEIQWPAPGATELALEIRDALKAAGIASAVNDVRGFDHGTFVPLALTYPEANVPTTQLSLKSGLDPREHIELGRVLEPLRDRGVFIIGSGMSYHNMRDFMSHRRGRQTNIAYDSRAFDEWLAETMELDVAARETRLVEWEQAPSGRAAHPREEHLLPLHVIAGAAGEDAASVPYRDVVMGAHVSAIHFG